MDSSTVILTCRRARGIRISVRFVDKALIVFLLLLSGCAAETADRQQPQPLGELVDVGGYRLHIYCTGEGSPPVVVASGGFSFDWGLVQPKVAQCTRICTYDPSGTAWSDRVKPGNLVTCQDRISELHRLLRSARINGPYVIVGFSIGALVARLYATEHLSDIAGMVLVDHAFIDTNDSEGAAKSQRQSSNLDSPPVLVSKTPITLDLEDNQNFAKLPARDQQLHRWASSIHSDRPTPEMAARCLSEIELHNKFSFPLGDKPLVVISTAYDSPRYVELQRKLLTLSRNSEQVIAENSTHMVIIDQPQIVISAIEKVVELARKRKHPPE